MTTTGSNSAYLKADKAYESGALQSLFMMRASLHIRLVLIIAAGICLMPGLTTAASAYISVLLYHRFDENRFSTTTTSSTQFDLQMEYLKSHGYVVLSMDQLADCVEGKRPVPEKGVVITIDDGFISEYDKAVPILKKYHFPFCIFVFTHGIGVKNYMSWDQLKQLDAWGGEVGCHTYTHPRLINLTEKDTEQEIKGSKGTLEKNLGRRVKYFAYPYGQYNDIVRALAKRAGFRLMLTSDPGSVGAGAEFDRLPRQAVVGAEMSLNDFAKKLMNPPLPVTGCFPKSGMLASDTIPEVSITLKDPGLYEPGRINLFLSEKKRLNAQFDSRTGVLSCKGPFHLTRKTNRIIVTAKRKSDGLFAMDSYLIVIPGTWSGMKYTMNDVMH